MHNTVWRKFLKDVFICSLGALSGGLISASAIILMQKNGLLLDNLIVCIITIALLYSKKVPAPFIVIGSIFLGFIL